MTSGWVESSTNHDFSSKRFGYKLQIKVTWNSFKPIIDNCTYVKNRFRTGYFCTHFYHLRSWTLCVMENCYLRTTRSSLSTSHAGELRRLRLSNLLGEKLPLQIALSVSLSVVLLCRHPMTYLLHFSHPPSHLAFFLRHNCSRLTQTCYMNLTFRVKHLYKSELFQFSVRSGRSLLKRGFTSIGLFYLANL